MSVHPLRIASARQSLRHVFVRDLVLECHIGVHHYEHMKSQRVRINLDLAVKEKPGGISDDLSQVVCYEQVVNKVRALIAAGHIKLVETLAEMIANLCLEDNRVVSVRVRVEKLDVFTDAASVGVEIERP